MNRHVQFSWTLIVQFKVDEPSWTFLGWGGGGGGLYCINKFESSTYPSHSSAIIAHVADIYKAYLFTTMISQRPRTQRPNRHTINAVNRQDIGRSSDIKPHTLIQHQELTMESWTTLQGASSCHDLFYAECPYRNEMKWWCFRPLLCTLSRLNWAKQTPGIMRRN